MAHPLTQQPPSSLPFAFASRPSPLAFGFGLPSTPTGFSTPFRAWSSPGQSPTKASLNRLRSDVGSSSLKRSRRSPSSSPPVSPTSSSSKVDLAALALQDGPVKSVKRTRVVNETPAVSNDMDVGILLASLPPSAHLQILLKLLQTHPTLSETVLGQIPQPDVKMCVREIQSAFDVVQKAAGGMRGGSEAWDGRKWERVRNDAEVFCKTASTYIRYFTANTKEPIETESIFTFLQPLTTQLQTLLQLVPAGATNNPVLDLAKLVLSVWSMWITTLSAEVNQRGGMYPHPVVTNWADALDRLVMKNEDVGVVFHWSLSSQPVVQNDSFSESFRQALVPVRDRFVSEVGWVIGRR